MTSQCVEAGHEKYRDANAQISSSGSPNSSEPSRLDFNQHKGTPIETNASLSICAPQILGEEVSIESHSPAQYSTKNDAILFATEKNSNLCNGLVSSISNHENDLIHPQSASLIGKDPETEINRSTLIPDNFSKDTSRSASQDIPIGTSQASISSSQQVVSSQLQRKIAERKKIDDDLEKIFARRAKGLGGASFQSASNLHRVPRASGSLFSKASCLDFSNSSIPPKKRSIFSENHVNSAENSTGETSDEARVTSLQNLRKPFQNIDSNKETGGNQANNKIEPEILPKRQMSEDGFLDPNLIRKRGSPTLSHKSSKGMLNPIYSVLSSFKTPFRKEGAEPVARGPTVAGTALTRNKPAIARVQNTKPIFSSLQDNVLDQPAIIGGNLDRITLRNACRVRFSDPGWGLKEAIEEFYEQDECWTANHYAQIVWKLACIAKQSSACQPRWCAAQVQKELRHRLEIETTLGRSSVIKSIVEENLKPQRYFIVVVSHVTSETFFVTDGWYEIECDLDAPLQRALAARRVFVGQKLGMCGAVLKSSGPMPVLESSSQAKLEISSNGVRRARCDSRMGSQPIPLFPIRISNIHRDGRQIPFLQATVVRKYPLKFLDKTEEGTTIRSFEEELAFRKSNPVSESEATSFFSVRISDGGEKEAILTVWRTCLSNYQSLEEGKSYQFISIVPSPKQKDLCVELISTNGTFWKPVPNTQQILPRRQLYSVAQLACLPISTEVDVVVGYLGPGLNGHVFIDASSCLLVVRPSRTQAQKAPFKGLKVGCIAVLENFKVADFSSKFQIQVLDFGFNSVIKSGSTFEQSSLRLYLDENLPFIDKLLEDAIAHTQTGTPALLLPDLVQVSGKFSEWKWVSGQVHASFLTLDGVRHLFKLPPSQWKSALALTLRGASLDRFRLNLIQGQFVDPKHFQPKLRATYLKSHSLIIGYNPYQLVSSLLRKHILSAPLNTIWEKEFQNLLVYFSKRSCLYKFNVFFDPRSQGSNNVHNVGKVSLRDEYFETPLPSQV